MGLVTNTHGISLYCTVKKNTNYINLFCYFLSADNSSIYMGINWFRRTVYVAATMYFGWTKYQFII